MSCAPDQEEELQSIVTNKKNAPDQDDDDHTHNNSHSLNTNNGAGAGAGAGGDDDAEDPFESTQQKRERVKLTQTQQLAVLDQKIDGFFDTRNWAFRVGSVGFVLAILAAAVPQWVYVVPSATTYGLRAVCSGDRCGAIDFASLKKTLDCGGSCSDAFDQFRLRWRAVEAFGWMGVVLLGLVAVPLRIGYTRDVRPDAMGAPHVVTSIAAIFAVAASVVIMGGSLSCGEGCFEYGASVICMLIAMGCAVACIPLGLISAKCGSKHRVSFGRLGGGMAVLGAAFEAAAMLTNKWFYALPTVGAALNGTSVGLWQKCIDGSCGTLDRKAVLAPGAALGCDATESDLAARFNAGGTFLIIGGVFCLALAIVAHYKIAEDFYLRTILVFVSLGFVTIGNSVVMATVDGWMFCGKTYCEVIVRSGTGDTSCQPGASFAFGLCCNLALGASGVFEIFNGFYKLCGVAQTESESNAEAALLQQLEAEKAERARIQAEIFAKEQEEAMDAVEEEEAGVRKKLLVDAEQTEWKAMYLEIAQSARAIVQAKAKAEREQREREERAQKEKEEQEQREREQREQEERAQKEREEQEQKEKQDREQKEKEEQEQREREEQEQEERAAEERKAAAAADLRKAVADKEAEDTAEVAEAEAQKAQNVEVIDAAAVAAGDAAVAAAAAAVVVEATHHAAGDKEEKEEDEAEERHEEAEEAAAEKDAGAEDLEQQRGGEEAADEDGDE